MNAKKIACLCLGSLVSLTSTAAPLLVSNSADNFSYTVPFGGGAPGLGSAPVSVITLGTDFVRDFQHTSSYMRLDVDLFGAAGWSGPNWPLGTAGTIDITTLFDVQLQEVDGTFVAFNTVMTEPRTFFYECEEEIGCPAGDPTLASGGFTATRRAQVSSLGREVAQAFSTTSVSVAFPQHGTGELNVSGQFRLDQRYEARYDKQFADFLSDTASEFDDRMTIISLASTAGSGATQTQVAANVLLEASALVAGGDACATTVISAAMKEAMARKIESLGPTAAVPGGQIVATAAMAASVSAIVSQCLAEDPPDFDVLTTIDPDVLVAGIDLPQLMPGSDGEQLAAAVERDLHVALLLAGALDAYERMQGAVILGDTEAEQLQAENYVALMERANALSFASREFYLDEAAGLYAQAGALNGLEIQQAIDVLALIDDAFIFDVLGPVDAIVVASLRARFQRLASIASAPGALDDAGAVIPALNELYDLLADYTTTDLRTVVENRIGGDFWEPVDDQPVVIDIRPHVERNRVFPRFGVIPVAILGSSSFDAQQVDPASLRFGPDQGHALPWYVTGRDITGDGFVDLLVFFIARRTGIRCGDTEATLSGQTWDGLDFSASDSIETVGCRHRHGAAL